MMELENSLKKQVNNEKEKIIGDKESVLTLIYEREHDIFLKLLEYEK